MLAPALLLSVGFVVVANPYGGGGQQSYNGPPKYPQNYRPSQQQSNNYPQGSGRPQYQSQSGYGQQSYDQVPQQSQYDNDEYHYAQQPLYPERPSYQTPPPCSPPYQTSEYPTTKHTPETTSVTQSTTTRGSTTTTGASTTTAQSITTEAPTTTVSTTTPSETTTHAPTTTHHHDHSTTTKDPSHHHSTTTKDSSHHHSTTTKDPSHHHSTTTDHHHHSTTTHHSDHHFGCPKIPCEKGVCFRNETTASLAVHCSVVPLGKLGETVRRPSGVCESPCSTKDDQIFEYNHRSAQFQPDCSTAIKNGAVSLIVACPKPEDFCTCSDKSCCKIEGDVKAVNYIPHCTNGKCKNVIFFTGLTGSLKCTDHKGGKEEVFLAAEKLKDQALDSKSLLSSMTSVSCNKCASINKGTTCVKP